MSDETKDSSPTWPHVLAFAEKMEVQLARNREKGDRPGWLSSNPGVLKRLLEEKLGALPDAQDVETKQRLLVDVANYAMMLADWWGEWAKKSPGAQAQE